MNAGLLAVQPVSPARTVGRPIPAQSRAPQEPERNPRLTRGNVMLALATATINNWFGEPWRSHVLDA